MIWYFSCACLWLNLVSLYLADCCPHVDDVRKKHDCEIGKDTIHCIEKVVSSENPDLQPKWLMTNQSNRKSSSKFLRLQIETLPAWMEKKSLDSYSIINRSRREVTKAGKRKWNEIGRIPYLISSHLILLYKNPNSVSTCISTSLLQSSIYKAKKYQEKITSTVKFTKYMY